ncbi:MAG: hypothetical protein ACTSPO_13135 [Candidatus Heimdallarchaeaceae archaeon]
MKGKILTADKIKKKYMRKLSIELINRGTSDNQIKSTLDDVSHSVDDYISEFKLENLRELEEKFGSPQDFCDNNTIIKSRAGSFGQYLLLTIMVISILIVPILYIISLYSVYSLPYILPFETLLKNILLLGVEGTNSGYGLVGTLFGLNAYIWILYQYYKDKFSKFDIRESIKSIILVMYWFLVICCLIPILDSYISHHAVIADMWSSGMGSVIIEGLFRWLAILSLLVITAIGYTKKFYNLQLNPKKISEEQNKYMIDNVGILASIFALTGFVSPGTGMGILLITIGFGLIFLRRIEVRIWLVSLIALFLQLILSIIEIIIIEIEQHIFSLRRTRIIFGILSNDAGDHIFTESIIAFCLLIIWLVFGLRILRRSKQRILPRFVVPKGKTKIFAIILVSLALISILGTKPQRTLYPRDGYLYQNTELHYIEMEQSYKIPGRGKVFMSLTTYKEQIWTSVDSNGTLTYESEHITGSWSVEWIHLENQFRSYITGGDFEEYTEPNYTNGQFNVSIRYLVFEVDKPGLICYTYRIYTNITIMVPTFQMQWSPIIPWFRGWYEITLFVCVVTLFFFEWDKKEIKSLKPSTKKGD